MGEVKMSQQKKDGESDIKSSTDGKTASTKQSGVNPSPPSDLHESHNANVARRHKNRTNM